jgi:oxaloacetate decarboxylase alpha subunit
MTARPKVRLVDTSLRDGNQSLWGATGLTTGMVEAVGPILERAGFHAIDFTSSTHLGVGVRWHKEDPWERISRMRAVVPTTPLSLITTGMRFISWDRASDAVMRLALQLLAKHGMRRLQIAEPMNDVAAALAVARLAKEVGIEQVVGAATFTESPIHTDAVYLEVAAALAAAEDIDAVYLKDPGGLLTMERAAVLLPGLRAATTGKTFELHSHCTTGVAPQVYVLAAQLGVDVLHTAIGPLANGTSQPSAARLIENLATVGIDVDVDVEAIAEADTMLRSFARRQGLEPGQPTELDLTCHVHQIPGGMMGTLRRQLTEMRIPDRLPEVIAEASLVRADLGYPIMVTPFSQFVGSQAVLNVVSASAGQPRYSRLPDEVIRYVLGQFGVPPGPVADAVLERVAELPRTKELDQPRSDPTLAELSDRVSAQIGREPTHEELLLRLVLPADQVDSMYAAGRAPAWTDDAELSPADFLDAVDRLPNWRSMQVVRGTTSLTLARERDGSVPR